MSDGIVVISEQDQAFLGKLIHLGRQYGWTGDYGEVCEFIKWTHRLFNAPVPSREDLCPLDN